MNYSNLNGRLKKYPMIDGSYESIDYHNLFYAGTLTHSLDFRKSSGGFIHGFRYTGLLKFNFFYSVACICFKNLIKARSLFKLIQSKIDSVKWPFKLISQKNIINYVIKRINESSGN